MRLDQHFDALVPTQVSDEHDRPIRMGDSLVEEKVVGNEVGDDLIGTPSGQPRAERDDRADRDERVHVSGAGAAAEGVRQRDTRADHWPVPRRRTADAGNRRRARTDVITPHQSLGGADVAVVVLGQHHGHPGAAGRADGRADAPVVSMHVCRTGPQRAAARSRSETQGPRSASRAAAPGRCRAGADVGQSSGCGARGRPHRESFLQDRPSAMVTTSTRWPRSTRACARFRTCCSCPPATGG